jgi:5-methylcytosine-specific restriction endonuclease McrA
MRSLNGLSDRELTRRLRKLVKNEQSLTIEILPHLAEVDRRELYLGYGYSSLSDYCVSHLGYGESSAWRRVSAARVVKAVPEVYDLLKNGQLTFSGVVLLSGALRAENKTELLSRVVGKTQGQIGPIVAEYKPPKRIPDQARPTLVIKAAKNEETAGTSATPDGAGAPPSAKVGEISLRSEGENNPPRPVLPAVELERMYDIRFAGDEELMELMAWMKTHLSGRYPKGASYLEMIKYAMTYVRKIEDLEKRAERRKEREKEKPKRPAKAASTSPESRHIPAREKEKVWIRDRGRCTYVGPDGRRCNSTHNLQFDHHPKPFARGGPSEASNLRLLCAKHNRYTAEKIFGKRDYNKQPAAGT